MTQRRSCSLIAPGRRIALAVEIGCTRLMEMCPPNVCLAVNANSASRALARTRRKYAGHIPLLSSGARRATWPPAAPALARGASRRKVGGERQTSSGDGKQWHRSIRSSSGGERQLTKSCPSRRPESSTCQRPRGIESGGERHEREDRNDNNRLKGPARQQRGGGGGSGRSGGRRDSPGLRQRSP